MQAVAPSPRAVVFDLDGTLIDSAPDLLAALDHVRGRLQLPPGDRVKLREHVSRGAAGLLEAGLSERPDLDAGQVEILRVRLLDFYAEHCWVHSEIFPGIERMLESLDARNLGLGIVTNKISRFAEPVVEQAGWSNRFACLITGDRVTAPKPDPEGLQAACRRLGVRPAQMVFVGDDRRDVLAGRAAGVYTVVAGWGYLPAGDHAESWGADEVIRHPDELLELAIFSEAA